ncbi:MAG: hypothetical protein ACK4NC_03510 [Candidatus Gracilibacteria bacterium]
MFETKNLESGSKELPLSPSIETSKDILGAAKQLMLKFGKKIKDIALMEVKLPKFGRAEKAAAVEDLSKNTAEENGVLAMNVLEDTLEENAETIETEQNPETATDIKAYTSSGITLVLDRDDKNVRSNKADGFGPDERSTKWNDETWSAYQKLTNRNTTMPDINVPTNTPDEILHFMVLAEQSFNTPVENFSKDMLIGRAEASKEYMERIGVIKALLITNAAQASAEATELKNEMLETGVYGKAPSLSSNKEYSDGEMIAAMDKVNTQLKNQEELDM